MPDRRNVDGQRVRVSNPERSFKKVVPGCNQLGFIFLPGCLWFRKVPLWNMPPPFKFACPEDPGYILVQLILKQPADKFGPWIILPFRFGTRQQETRLQADQGCCQLHEFAGLIQIQSMQAVRQHIEELPRNLGDGDIEDIDVLGADKVKKEIEGTLKPIDLYDERLCVPGTQEAVWGSLYQLERTPCQLYFVASPTLSFVASPGCRCDPGKNVAGT